MVFFGYLTDNGKESLKHYKYSGADLSLIYKYILSPWAQYCVDNFTPFTIAPNSITLIGLLFPVSSVLYSYYLNPNFENTTTSYSALYAAFCIFFYSTMDNMDGKHARRTGSSSPLGLLFDHGCDAINAGLIGWLIISLHFNTGTNSWTTFVQFICTTMVFFFNTYEEYHIGTLILPIINGANEGLLIGISTLLVTSYYGSSAWSNVHSMFAFLVWGFAPVIDTMRWVATIPTGSTSNIGTNIYSDCIITDPFNYFICWFKNLNTFGTNNGPTNVELVLAFLVMAAFSTVVSQIYNVCKFEYTKSKGDINTVYAAFRRQLPYWSLLVTMTLWLHDSLCASIVHQHWLLFYSTGGILFVDMVTKLMVSHVANQEYTPLYNGIALFALAPLFIKFNLVPSFVTAETLVSFYLLISFSYAILTTTGYLLDAIEDITTTLDIDVFNIDKQLSRNNNKKSSTSTTISYNTPLSPSSTSITSATTSSTTSTSKKRVGSASPAARKRK